MARYISKIKLPKYLYSVFKVIELNAIWKQFLNSY